MPGYRPWRSVFSSCSSWVNLGNIRFICPISLIWIVITGIPLLISLGISSSLFARSPQTRSLLTHPCESDWTHLERAKHSSTIPRACGRLSTDQLQSVKKLLRSRLGPPANGFSSELRLFAREIGNASPLRNDEVAQARFE